MGKNGPLNLVVLPVLVACLALSACGTQPVGEGSQEEAEMEVEQMAPAKPFSFAAIKQAAAAGDKDSQYQVGVWYEENHPGSPRDLVRAYAWYKLAMNQGDLGAKYALERFEAQLTEQQRAAAEALVARWHPGDTLEK